MKLFTSRLPQPQGFICDAWGNVPAPHIPTPEDVLASLIKLPEDLRMSVVEQCVMAVKPEIAAPVVTRMDRRIWGELKPEDLA